MSKGQQHILGEALEELLTKVHEQQVSKAWELARRIRPELTREDLLSPDDFPEIAQNPAYMYEDGLAAGILTAKIAVAAFLRERVLGRKEEI